MATFTTHHQLATGGLECGHPNVGSDRSCIAGKHPTSAGAERVGKRVVVVGWIKVVLPIS